MKTALITGASGMVGGLVLRECLTNDDISKVIILVRKNLDVSHSKLTEILHQDYEDYSSIAHELANIDIAFFCIGVYTGQVSDHEFKKITVDFPVALSKSLLVHNPNATFCLLSGAGADKTEKSRVSFAKYKGMAENQIAALSLGGFYTLRPGYIYPVEAREEPNVFYRITRMLYPLIKLFGKKYSIKSTDLAKAMVAVGLLGAEKEILENIDLLGYISQNDV